MINGRLFVQNIADTQIQFCCVDIKNDVKDFDGCKLDECIRYAWVSFHRRRTENDRYRLQEEGCLFCKISVGFLVLINCLAQSGLIWGRIRCNNLRGEERQDDF